MAWSGLRFSRFERHNHLPGLQEVVARSNRQGTARTIRARTHPAGEGTGPALQGTTAQRPHRLAGRSYRASEPGCRGDRLLWTKNKCDFRPCLAARTDGRPDCSRALRAAVGRTLPNNFSPKDRSYRRDDAPADRASMLELLRTLCTKKSSALALDVQTLALPPGKRRAALSILCASYGAVRPDCPTRRKKGEEQTR